MGKRKQAAAFLLTAVMALSVMPLPGTISYVSADEPETDTWDGTTADGFAGGTGTQEDPYQIATAEQLAGLAQDVNEGNAYKDVYFLLTADLDLSGHNWTPVGTYSETPADRRPFEGYFDGDFHTISNLTISTESDYQGLFGFIDNDRAYYSTPSVSSLIVKNPDLEQTGENSCAIGSIAGTISFGYLFNCGVEGGTVAGNDNVGGLVGQTLHNTARIYACYNAGTAVFGDMLAGGVLYGGTVQKRICGVCFKF